MPAAKDGCSGARIMLPLDCSVSRGVDDGLFWVCFHKMEGKKYEIKKDIESACVRAHAHTHNSNLMKPAITVST